MQSAPTHFCGVRVLGQAHLRACMYGAVAGAAWPPLVAAVSVGAAASPHSGGDRFVQLYPRLPGGKLAAVPQQQQNSQRRCRAQRGKRRCSSLPEEGGAVVANVALHHG